VGYLIDTSVCVAWERGDLNQGDLVRLAAGEELALSAITASELLHGVHRADTAQRRGRRQRFVDSVLAALPVLPIDLEVSRVHSQIWADLRARGEIIGAHDLLIAATALTRSFALATRNEREFRRIVGLRLALW
jgi:tRNA(fMet)-specific endonuclease VapC